MPKNVQPLAPLVVAPPAPKLTAGDIRAALKLYFPHPEQAAIGDVKAKLDKAMRDLSIEEDK